MVRHYLNGSEMVVAAIPRTNVLLDQHNLLTDKWTAV